VGERGEVAQKLWGGAFGEATHPLVERFSSSIAFDRALARYDVRVSLAHARMLGEAGIIGAADADALVGGLERIRGEIETDSFLFEDKFEDVHTAIELRLGSLVGEVAGRLHTGRSRNDQVATDLALFLREITHAARLAIAALRSVLVERSRQHVGTVLPGYTHLQRAQPVRLAHHWLAYVEMLGRDAARFAGIRERLARCPLGAGALAGSTLPLDPAATAAALGFDGPLANSMDAVASRDAALEFLAAAAICMVHLSRLAEELVLWSTSEFGFIEFSDAHRTGSSLMPQKRNPDVPELVRGKAGRAIGNLVTLLTVVKGLPLTYNRDLQEDKEPVIDSATTLRDSLGVLADAIGKLKVNEDRMRLAAGDPLLLATDLAETLVREGVPFREAHEAVGRVVAHCGAKKLDLRALTREDLRAFHSAFPSGAREILDLERSLEARSLAGGTARARVAEALERSAREIAAERETLEREAAAEREAREREARP
jgi:argininosuccinate lyase